MAINPRPDQIQRVKNLGMHLSGWDLYVWEGSGYQVLQDYGERAAQWIIPRKNLLDAGVTQSVEIDRPIGYTSLNFFNVLHTGISRKDQNDRLISPQQALSREAMLKAATLWGAYYTKREDRLGSLKAGKLADLAVLDRDYLAIPVDDIPNIRVLMTVVGGKVVHLAPSMARESGMQPTGAQVDLGGPAAQW
jgi:predicted amidohydrolase YtcJ